MNDDEFNPYDRPVGPVNLLPDKYGARPAGWAIAFALLIIMIGIIGGFLVGGAI